MEPNDHSVAFPVPAADNYLLSESVLVFSLSVATDTSRIASGSIDLTIHIRSDALMTSDTEVQRPDFVVWFGTNASHTWRLDFRLPQPAIPPGTAVTIRTVSDGPEAAVHWPSGARLEIAVATAHEGVRDGNTRLLVGGADASRISFGVQAYNVDPPAAYGNSTPSRRSGTLISESERCGGEENVSHIGESVSIPFETEYLAVSAETVTTDGFAAGSLKIVDGAFVVLSADGYPASRKVSVLDRSALADALGSHIAFEYALCGSGAADFVLTFSIDVAP